MTVTWIDFETNDLDPRTCRPLEVACIITDDAFNEVARYRQVIYWDGSAKVLDWLRDGVETFLQGLSDEDRVQYIRCKLAGSSVVGYRIDPIVVDMHLKNGLWKESIAGLALDTVDRQLSQFIEQHSVRDRIKPELAGSSVGYDREVMRNHLPRAFGALNYRVIDVSTLIEMAKRVWPAVEAGRPSARKLHRAMTDIEDSLNLMRYYVQVLGHYVERFGPATPPVTCGAV